MATDDPLDGYRARTDEDDVNEEIVRGVRGLSEMGIDYKSISDLIFSNDLRLALAEDTILAKLAVHCNKVMMDNATAWATADDPRSVDRLHIPTRAAGLVIQWIDEIIQTGQVAEQLVDQQEIKEDE